VVIIFFVGVAIGGFLGLRFGRAWGFRQLGAAEHADRIARAKRSGGLGLW
jgi:hypothetical protein